MDVCRIRVPERRCQGDDVSYCETHKTKGQPCVTEKMQAAFSVRLIVAKDAM